MSSWNITSVNETTINTLAELMKTSYIMNYFIKCAILLIAHITSYLLPTSSKFRFKNLYIELHIT
jgi:hypothetical protein